MKRFRIQFVLVGHLGEPIDQDRSHVPGQFRLFAHVERFGPREILTRRNVDVMVCKARAKGYLALLEIDEYLWRVLVDIDQDLFVLIRLAFDLLANQLLFGVELIVVEKVLGDVDGLDGVLERRHGHFLVLIDQ